MSHFLHLVAMWTLLYGYLSQQNDYLVLCTFCTRNFATAVLFTSTRWLSGPYNSLSNSMTRLLKYVENFRFCLGPSVFGGWVWRKTITFNKARTTCLQPWNLLLLTSVGTQTAKTCWQSWMLCQLGLLLYIINSYKEKKHVTIRIQTS